MAELLAINFNGRTLEHVCIYPYYYHAIQIIAHYPMTDVLGHGNPFPFKRPRSKI